MHLLRSIHFRSVRLRLTRSRSIRLLRSTHFRSQHTRSIRSRSILQRSIRSRIFVFCIVVHYWYTPTFLSRDCMQIEQNMCTQFWTLWSNRLCFRLYFLRENRNINMQTTIESTVPAVLNLADHIICNSMSYVWR